jgi:hypothetical protein
MKKIIYCVSFIMIAILVFNACSGSTDKTSGSNDTIQSAKTQYTCTMHPEVIQDKPGKCPKCGMDLVEKK